MNLFIYCRAAQVVLIIFAVSIFISYALQAYVPISILWGTYLIQKYENSDRKLLFEFATRLAVVIFTCKFIFLICANSINFSLGFR